MNCISMKKEDRFTLSGGKSRVKLSRAELPNPQRKQSEASRIHKAVLSSSASFPDSRCSKGEHTRTKASGRHTCGRYAHAKGYLMFGRIPPHKKALPSSVPHKCMKREAGRSTT